MKGGFFSLYKPAGVTSHQVLSGLKRIFDTRKVGHMGTLDPLAEGILPVATEESTRLIEFIKTEPKIYEVEIFFGFSTPTCDAESLTDLSALPIIPQMFDEKTLLAEISNFVGGYEQTPPIFSAKKVGGVKAYDVARKDPAAEFDLKPVFVQLNSAKIIDFKWPYCTLLIEVGSGFYVRSFIKDLSEKLSVEAFMFHLKRVSCGEFRIDNSVLPEDFAKGKEFLLSKMIPVDLLIPDFHCKNLNFEESENLRNGRPIKFDGIDEVVFAYFNDTLVSVLKRTGEFEYRILKNFLHD